jgi:hypothetical protein
VGNSWKENQKRKNLINAPSIMQSGSFLSYLHSISPAKSTGRQCLSPQQKNEDRDNHPSKKGYLNLIDSFHLSPEKMYPKKRPATANWGRECACTNEIEP